MCFKYLLLKVIDFNTIEKYLEFVHSFYIFFIYVFIRNVWFQFYTNYNPPAAGPARAAAPNWASNFAAVQYEILNNKNIKILLFLIIFQSFIIIISNLVLEICKTLLT